MLDRLHHLHPATATHAARLLFRTSPSLPHNFLIFPPSLLFSYFLFNPLLSSLPIPPVPPSLSSLFSTSLFHPHFSLSPHPLYPSIPTPLPTLSQLLFLHTLHISTSLSSSLSLHPSLFPSPVPLPPSLFLSYFLFPTPPPLPDAAGGSAGHGVIFPLGSMFSDKTREKLPRPRS